jgi:hypothetical protein
VSAPDAIPRTVERSVAKIEELEVRGGGLEPVRSRGNRKEFQRPNRQESPSTATNCVRRTHLRDRSLFSWRARGPDTDRVCHPSSGNSDDRSRREFPAAECSLTRPASGPGAARRRVCCAWASSASGCAKIVRTNVATRLCALFGTFVRRLRMRCVRHRCQAAPGSVAARAAAVPDAYPRSRAARATPHRPRPSRPRAPGLPASHRHSPRRPRGSRRARRWGPSPASSTRGSRISRPSGSTSTQSSRRVSFPTCCASLPAAIGRASFAGRDRGGVKRGLFQPPSQAPAYDYRGLQQLVADAARLHGADAAQDLIRAWGSPPRHVRRRSIVPRVRTAPRASSGCCTDRRRS